MSVDTLEPIIGTNETAAKPYNRMDYPIEIYSDGASLETIRSLDKDTVTGLTFNPSLFKSLGITDYLGFCKEVIDAAEGIPVSFEVIADDAPGMISQALRLSAVSDQVYVKVPITFTNGQSTLSVLDALVKEGVKLNVTAVFSIEQVKPILDTLKLSNAIISVFAGRLFDIGLDAIKITSEISEWVHAQSNCRTLWASPRMVYDVINASTAGCDIITMPFSLIKKLELFGKAPSNYSLETVKMFYKDANASGYAF